MKINELSKLTGLSIHTIRFYEKEELFDTRHVTRDINNYRIYTEEALLRINMIKKFQGIGCSLTELKEILKDKDENIKSNEEIIEWIEGKMEEIENKKREYDSMLVILESMLEYRKSF